MAKRTSVDVVVKARDQASKKFNLIGGSATNMGRLIRRAAAMAAVYFGGRAMIRQAQGAVALWAEQERSVNALSNALALLNKQHQTKEMEKYAAQLQKVTTYGDEVILQTMALGSSMGQMAGKELKDATKAAIGLSAAYDMDLNAAMRLVARARHGDTASLRRYGIVLEDGLTQQEKFNQVLEIGRRNFSLAEGQVNTYAGAMAQMRNAVGDLREQIGRALVPTIMESANRIKEWAENNSRRAYEWTAKTISYVQLVKDVFVDIISFLRNDWQGAFRYAFQSVVEMGKVFAKTMMDMMVKLGDDMIVPVLRGLVSAMTSTVYFTTKGVIDGLVGAALDGTTFKEHLKNVQDYGRNISKTLIPDITSDKKWGDISVNFKSEIKEALGKISKNMPADLRKAIDDSNAKYLDRLAEIVSGGRDIQMGADTPAQMMSDVVSSIGQNLKQNLQAVESRFLTFSPGQTFGDSPEQRTERNTARMATGLDKMIKHAETINRNLIRMDQSLLDISRHGGFGTAMGFANLR